MSAARVAALEELGLSNRATNALHRGGISTLEQLCAVPRLDDSRGLWRSHLRMIPGLGQKTETEVIAALERVGLDLAPVSPFRVSRSYACPCPACAVWERQRGTPSPELVAAVRTWFSPPAPVSIGESRGPMAPPQAFLASVLPFRPRLVPDLPGGAA